MNIIARLIIVTMVTHVSHVTCEGMRIGAFNIQVFGRTKASNATVMDYLVKIIRRYDILLIQEIRDTSDTAIHQLLEEVNRDLPQDKIFSMVLSARLGRTISKEQYAFFYRPGAGIQVESEREYVEPPTQDIFQREPYIVTFTSSVTVLERFTLVGIHVDPDDAVQEINGFYDVFHDIKEREMTSDVMILGDLNADCRYVSSSDWEKIPIKNDVSYTWYISDDADTTVKVSTDCAYDRFIATGPEWNAAILPDSVSVYYYNTDVGLLGQMDQDTAEDISDHFPIEFLMKKRTALLTIQGVYVYLVNRDKSLIEKPYDVRDCKETQCCVFDGVTKVGHIFDEILVKTFLLLDMRNEMPGVHAEPVRNRYNGRQWCHLSAAVPYDISQGAKDIIDLMCLDFVCDLS